ncbi:MAG: hypothetical protein IPM46_04520 [Flavobacteriales bacterium]|nr:hypothetical protein [Flavobacteriales bacterium]
MPHTSTMLRNALFMAGVLPVFALSAQGPSAGDHDHGTGTTGPVLHGEYVENKGQWSAPIRYRADFGLVALFAEQDRLVFSKLEDGATDRGTMRSMKVLAPWKICV